MELDLSLAMDLVSLSVEVESLDRSEKDMMVDAFSSTLDVMMGS
jgi:hypothetical protein